MQRLCIAVAKLVIAMEVGVNQVGLFRLKVE